MARISAADLSVIFLGGSMSIDQILDELITLRDNWYATEKHTGDVVWGECAYDLDSIIEKAADEK